jgi:hypothetical protein
MQSMKVTRNNPDTLILESRPLIVGLLIILVVLGMASAGMSLLGNREIMGGFVFLVVAIAGGGLAFWIIVRRSQIWFDATDGQIAIRQATLTGFEETVVPLSELKEAIVQQSAGTGKTTNRVALRCGGRTNRIIPLTVHYTSGPGPARAARVINDWLANHVAPPPGSGVSIRRPDNADRPE